MESLDKYFLIGAVVVASIGAISDVRKARIPNWLTYSSLITALVLRAGLMGWSGFKSGALGMLAAGGIFLILFVLGAMGGGDMKLMAAIGAWVGSAYVVTILLVAAMAGGVLALVQIIFGRRGWQTLRNLLELLRFRLTSGLQPHPVLNVREAGSDRVPYGLAIALATVYCARYAIWWR